MPRPRAASRLQCTSSAHGWSIGLGTYAELFAREQIGFDVLPQLSEQDLKELGLPLGDRKRILKAVAELGGPSPPPPPPPPAGGARGSPPFEAERRQLTVMFVDLVGSTALSAPRSRGDARGPARLPERGRGRGAAAGGSRRQVHGRRRARLLRLAQGARGRRRAGGPRRARGADAVAGSRTAKGEPLAARVGIATGLVVVGDLIGEGAAREEAVVGETPNLAARLQALAEPGAVVVAEARGGWSAPCSSRGSRPCRGQGLRRARAGLPGRRARVAAEGRFEALHAERPDAARRPRAGAGACCSTAGGRPRRARARSCCSRRARHRQVAHRPRPARAAPPRAARSAALPLLALPHAQRPLPGDRAARAGRRLRAATTPEAKLDKLEALLARAVPDRECAPLLAELLVASRPGSRYPPPELTPQQQKARTFEALLAQLEGSPAAAGADGARGRALDRSRPPSSCSTSRSTGSQRLPVLLVVTFRPEFRPPWTGHRTSPC